MNTQGVNFTDTLSHLLPNEENGQPIQVQAFTDKTILQQMFFSKSST